MAKLDADLEVVSKSCKACQETPRMHGGDCDCDLCDNYNSLFYRTS